MKNYQNSFTILAVYLDLNALFRTPAHWIQWVISAWYLKAIAVWAGIVLFRNLWNRSSDASPTIESTIHCEWQYGTEAAHKFAHGKYTFFAIARRSLSFSDLVVFVCESVGLRTYIYINKNEWNAVNTYPSMLLECVRTRYKMLIELFWVHQCLAW